MKLKHTTTIILTILIIALLFTSCTSEVSYIDDETDETPLRIYLTQYDRILRQHIQYYNKMKPKGKSEVEIVEFEWEKREDMYKQILNEISAGKGPDIIPINRITDNYLDIYKISEQNAFADMDILIENNGNFNFNDYNKTILDAGIINDKRVFMPYSYKVEFIIAVEECFKNNNLKVPDELTLDIYLDLIEEYYQNTNSPAIFGIDPIYLLAESIEYDKQIEKTDELRRIFQLLKIENERMVNVQKGHGTIDHYNVFISNNYLFIQSRIFEMDQFRLLHAHYNIIENMYDSNMIFFNQPINENNSLKSYVSEGFAININSKHKNESFEFVEYMLSKVVQSNSLNFPSLPVNKEAFEYEKRDFIDGYNLFDSNELPNETHLPEKLVEEFIEYVESPETCDYIGNLKYIYHNIINQSIKDYYNDKLTFDELIDEMNNKLSIYYSE